MNTLLIQCEGSLRPTEKSYPQRLLNLWYIRTTPVSICGEMIFLYVKKKRLTLTPFLTRHDLEDTLFLEQERPFSADAIGLLCKKNPQNKPHPVSLLSRQNTEP